MELAGAFLVSKGRMKIVDSNVTDVKGANMGGVFALSGGVLDISNCYFEKATAAFMGAFIAGLGSATVITVRDSVARDMGLLGSFSWNIFTLFDGPTMTVSKTRFEGCQKGIFSLALVSAIGPPHPHTHHGVSTRPWSHPHAVPPPLQRHRPSSTTATLRGLFKTAAPLRTSGRVLSSPSPARPSSAAPLSMHSGAPSADALCFSSTMATK